MELVEGNRKVVCDAFISDKDNKLHNRFWLYEDEKLLMIAVMSSCDFISYNDRKFKTMPCNEFFNRFITNGLNAFTVKQMIELINPTGYRDKKKWDFALIFDSGIEITYENQNQIYYNPYFKIWMEVFDKTIVACPYNYSNFFNHSYDFLKTYAKQDVLDNVERIDIKDVIEEYGDKEEDENIIVIKEYGMSFKIYSDIYKRMTKPRNLLKTGFLETGHLFKIRDEDKMQLAKKKVLFSDIPEIKSIDNGYAVF
jgi:hypothetical protein